MTEQRLRIVFSDLPLRPRPLGDSALERVFGGCSNNYCKKDVDCCMRHCYIFPNADHGSCRQNVG